MRKLQTIKVKLNGTFKLVFQNLLAKKLPISITSYVLVKK